MQSKTYDIDGKRLSFRTDVFKRHFFEDRTRRGIKRDEEYNRIGSVIGVSPSTVENWYKGKNAPSDPDLVEALAHAVGLQNRLFLLKEIAEENRSEKMKNNKLTERQIAAFKRITDKFFWFHNEARNSDFFNDYYRQFVEACAADPVAETQRVVRQKYNELLLVYDQEYFDLHDTKLYEELPEYLDLYYDCYVMGDYPIKHLDDGEESSGLSPLVDGFYAAFEEMRYFITENI